MKLSDPRNLGRLVLFAIVVGFVLSVGFIGENSRAQEKTGSPARTGYVNDFAGVLDDKTRQRLETVLSNVRKRSGIEFDLATVQTTGNRDIFAFSRQLAVDWKLGSRSSTKKSLLLVVSVDEKAVFTQFSRSVQGELPEGILGELSQRVRDQIGSDRFSQGLNDGVDHFVTNLAKKLGFSLQDIDQADSVALNSTPVSESQPTAKTTDEPEPVVQTPPAKTSTSRYAVASASRPRTTTFTKSTTAADDEAEAEEVELTLTLPLNERVTKLKEFLEAHPNSKAKARAGELLVSSYAGLGDQKLKSGDSKGGIEQLMLAITEAPANTSDKLFSGVISQVPANLYLRGHRAEANEAARLVETKFGEDPKRLLAIASFYLGLEQGEEAARISAQAVKLAPDLAEAHHALALSLHISLRLDDAAAEYKRALELDPASKKGARRSLADLTRAAGKPEEALALYREQLNAEPADKAARTGLVISLLDLGRTEEANKELAAALQDDPRNLSLLTGAAYWFAAHSNSEKALELARKAVELEPRYTWSQIALARALILQKNPSEAERAIRFARRYGKFPTLDYELANVLASTGLYEEAAEVMLQSFALKDGQLETQLAGRVAAREPDFIKLLAPERRASIFQFAMADTESNAAALKALLALTIATTRASDSDKLDEAKAAEAAKEFAAGTDDMRAYRQLYAAGLLLRNRIALQTAYELAEEAKGGVDAALGVAAATVAVQAEEYRDIRARAIAQGNMPDIAEAPPNVLANILRGRIEDLTGWALYNQEKTDEAIVNLKRASTILPEGTPLWRTAFWHLGAALEQAGNKPEALGYYIKSYNSGEPNPGRRAVIEQLYQKINGSLDGLDDRIGAKLVAANVSPEPTVAKPEGEMPTPGPSPELKAAATPESTPTPAAELSPIASPTAPAPTPEVAPTPAPSPSPTAETAPSPTPEASTASPTASPQAGVSRADREPIAELTAKLRATVKIAGRVSDANNAAIANAVVVLISPRGTVLATTTDTEGNYSFIVSPSQHGYRIIPSKDGYTFAPIDKVLAGFSDDLKDVDFIGGRAHEP